MIADGSGKLIRSEYQASRSHLDKVNQPSVKLLKDFNHPGCDALPKHRGLEARSLSTLQHRR